MDKKLPITLSNKRLDLWHIKEVVDYIFGLTGATGATRMCLYKNFRFGCDRMIVWITNQNVFIRHWHAIPISQKYLIVIF